MPILSVKLCASPSTELSAAVASALTTITADVLKKKAPLTAVVIDYVPPAQWFVDGVCVQTASFSVDIKVTEGTNTKDEKALFVAQVFAAMQALLGATAAVNYVVIHELRADAWGYNGQTQERRYIIPFLDH
jgi:4-oxalocrotonate tautomerase